MPWCSLFFRERISLLLLPQMMLPSRLHLYQSSSSFDMYSPSLSTFFPGLLSCFSMSLPPVSLSLLLSPTLSVSSREISGTWKRSSASRPRKCHNLLLLQTLHGRYVLRAYQLNRFLYSRYPIPLAGQGGSKRNFWPSWRVRDSYWLDLGSILSPVILKSI